MSKRTRAGILAAMLAAMTLAGMTAVAHAQATDEPTSKQAARRPPTQGQVGEAWHQPQVAPAVPDDVRRPPTESQVGEPWRHQTDVSARPAEPDGQPGWRMASLGFLAAALALAGGLAVPRRHPARPQHPRRAVDLITVAVTSLDGAAALTRQPHHLANDELVP
jgi:hypothetical protein